MVAGGKGTKTMDRELKSEVPTLRKVLKNQAELEYWNKYVAKGLGIVDPVLLWTVEVEVTEFNNQYREEWLDKPVNLYCDALIKYVNLIGVRNR